MKIGIVCPYSWDVPGGVQSHIRDLAEALIDYGHEVSVISPADDDTPLAKEMKTVNKSIRTMKRQIDDPAKKDDNLQLIATAKKSLDECLKLEPAKTKDVPAADKAAYVDKYKSEMKEVVKTFDDLEAAVKDGKTDDAKKIFEKLADQKEKGHKDFNPDDK